MKTEMLLSINKETLPRWAFLDLEATEAAFGCAMPAYPLVDRKRFTMPREKVSFLPCPGDNSSDARFL